MRFWHNLLSCLTKPTHKGFEQWLEACRGYTDNVGYLHRWPLWHKESPRNHNTERPDSTMQPRRETALVRPDLVDPNSHISEQQPEVIQGRGHDVTKPRTLLLCPVGFQMHRTSEALIHMYSIITICITIVSEHYRKPHHMSLQCGNGSYLHLTALHQLNKVVEKDVSVPLTESFCIVGHLEDD